MLFVFTVEHLAVEADLIVGCYDYLTISFDSGDVEYE